jgi:hypothetical protein
MISGKTFKKRSEKKIEGEIDSVSQKFTRRQDESKYEYTCP